MNVSNASFLSLSVSEFFTAILQGEGRKEVESSLNSFPLLLLLLFLFCRRQTEHLFACVCVCDCDDE